MASATADTGDSEAYRTPSREGISCRPAPWNGRGTYKGPPALRGPAARSQSKTRYRVRGGGLSVGAGFGLLNGEGDLGDAVLLDQIDRALIAQVRVRA